MQASLSGISSGKSGAWTGFSSTISDANLNNNQQDATL
jgi:hypothetical protein